jgi:hypothetical protein
MSDPLHSSEREIQERTGERDRAVLNGRLIASAIPQGARTFLTQQFYCVLARPSHRLADRHRDRRSGSARRAAKSVAVAYG